MLTTRRMQNDPLHEMQREFDRAIGAFGFSPLGRWSDSTQLFPAVNLWENGDKIFVEAEVPGFSMDQVEVLVDGQELTIKGRHEVPTEKDQVWHRRERVSGEFVRHVTLPLEVDAEKVEASLKDGVLMIVLPKHERARARKITVKTV